MSPSRAADWERLSQLNKLTDSDIESISKKLDRMDASAERPWTRRTLQLISEQPGIVSTVLSRQVGMERYAFKALVRKLKQQGLTHSLEVGYCLSPRGRAYLKLTKS